MSHHVDESCAAAEYHMLEGLSTNQFSPSDVLKTKLHIPELRPNLVSRPRLVERFTHGLMRPLTLVSAPAGSGKTTLISEWHASPRGQQVPLAWLSLDPDDNDPAHFMAYVIAALETVRPGVGAGALAFLQSPQPAPPQAVATALLNGLSEITTDFVMVLDDYHVIEAQPIHSALASLLDHMPPRMHLVIASRVDPPIPLARLRARDQLTEIRAADLRFASQEAAVFLNKVMGLNLSSEDIAALEARTEGWIAGLQLAALSIRNREDVSAFITAFTGSHRFILDYLVEEVLSRQPEIVQTFLLQTSILDRMCGPLCDAVTGRTDSHTVLAMLEQANVFTIPLDEERHWYRYHHLFAEFLKSRLPQALSMAHGALAGAELHRRAAEWFEHNGLVADAIRHALDGQSFEQAARLIEGIAHQTLTRGEDHTVLGWLGALPDAMIQARPRLFLARAYPMLLMGQSDVVELYLQEAMQKPWAGDAEIQGELAVIRASLAMLKGDLSSAIELSRQALDQSPTDDLFLRGSTALNLGDVYSTRRDMAAASRAYSQAYTISQSAGDTLLNLVAATQWANLKILQGQLFQAADLYQQALHFAIGPGRQLPVVSMAHAGMGWLLYQWNDLDAALEHFCVCVELGQRWEIADMMVTVSIYLAHIKQAQGDAAGARELIQQAEQAMQGNIVKPATIGTARAYQVRLWVRQGNLDAATRWMLDYQSRSGDTPGYLPELEKATWARVRLAQGQPETVPSALEPWLPIAEAAGLTGSVIEFLTLQALAFQAQGQSAQALAKLGRALALAEPEGYVRLFVDEGEPMRLLILDLRLWIEKQSRGQDQKLIGYIDRLLAAFAQPVARPQSKTSNLKSTMVEPLSERELQVLNLVANGLMNREIADKLVVTVGTVKRHVSNIHAKLGVRNRTEAVAKARELHLI
jgi:LuxR family maltose regulon positive regulatory protein